MAQLTFEQMKSKLEMLYNKQKAVEAEIERLVAIREQTIEDIELCETLIMHQLNKEERISKYEH